MRVLYSGESHMEAVIAVIEGFPAGFKIDGERINRDLSRRQSGYGRGDRMKIETDRVKIYSGIIASKSIGSPITLVIPNRDVRRSSWNPDDIRTVPRPGHAEMAGVIKYGFRDTRLVAERASARQTAAWAAAGSLFAQFLEEFRVRIVGFVESIGGVEAPEVDDPFSAIDNMESSPFRTANPASDEMMKDVVDRAGENGDTLGGVFQVVIRGCPIGLGSYTHPDRRLDAKLASAFMGIPSVKGVEIGLGFKSAETPGSEMQDVIESLGGKIIRRSNNAGGIEGGMSNGEDIVIRAAAKPIPTLGTPLPSVDIQTGNKAASPYVRSDVCVLPAISVIGEAIAAQALCECFLEKFGGDNMVEVRERFESVIERQGRE